MSIASKLFTERFRPKDLDEIVLLDRVKEQVKNGVQQNILLASSPGRGKTSLAYLLCNLNEIPYLYINASRETSVEVVREQIVRWCSEPSLFHKSKMKAVILDEIDGFSDQAFKALRGTIEQFTDEARFIATCNYIEKIPDAITSRLMLIDLEPQTAAEEQELKVKYYKKVATIAASLDVKPTKDGIVKLVDIHFPDMRATINHFENLYLSGKHNFNGSDVKAYSSSFEELFQHLLSKEDSVKTYKLVNEKYAKKIDDALVALGTDFVEYIRANSPQHISLIPNILIIAAEYQYKSKFTIDKLVNLLACIFKLKSIIP